MCFKLKFIKIDTFVRTPHEKSMFLNLFFRQRNLRLSLLSKLRNKLSQFFNLKTLLNNRLPIWVFLRQGPNIVTSPKLISQKGNDRGNNIRLNFIRVGQADEFNIISINNRNVNIIVKEVVNVNFKWMILSSKCLTLEVVISYFLLEHWSEELFIHANFSTRSWQFDIFEKYALRFSFKYLFDVHVKWKRVH